MKMEKSMIVSSGPILLYDYQPNYASLTYVIAVRVQLVVC